jgi:hypothetical protein
MENLWDKIAKIFMRVSGFSSLYSASTTHDIAYIIHVYGILVSILSHSIAYSD